MSRYDLVSAQTSNVCITHHAALNAVHAKQFVMSLPAMSLGDWFSMSCRKVGRGEVGWYIHPKSENSMVVCGFGCVSAQMVLESSHIRRHFKYIVLSTKEQCTDRLQCLHVVWPDSASKIKVPAVLAEHG